jgi:hypothetical protein
LTFDQINFFQKGRLNQNSKFRRGKYKAFMSCKFWPL